MIVFSSLPPPTVGAGEGQEQRLRQMVEVRQAGALELFPLFLLFRASAWTAVNSMCPVVSPGLSWLQGHDGVLKCWKYWSKNHLSSESGLLGWQRQGL